MELARDRFNIPMVLEPEYLASPYLDELSGMTYLSYFMKDKSPGTKATLNWVNSQLKNHTVSNFTVSVYRISTQKRDALTDLRFRPTGKMALYCVN